jgi:hypothetical protein
MFSDVLYWLEGLVIICPDTADYISVTDYMVGLIREVFSYFSEGY